MKKEAYKAIKQNYDGYKSEFIENVNEFYNALRLDQNPIMVKYSLNAIKSGKKALGLGKSLEIDAGDIKGLLRLITTHNNFLKFTPHIKYHHSEGILRTKFKNLCN